MKRLLSLIIIYFISIYTYGQSNIIATIGNESISANEFKARFETMPHVLDEYYNIDSVKFKVLNNIIAEKLWAMEAVSNGYDTTAYFKELFAPIENIFVRDALFQKEVAPLIVLSKIDIAHITINSNKKCLVKIYILTDSVSANSAYNSLISKKSIDKNIEYIVDSSQVITIGSLDSEELENEVFALKNNQFLSPVYYGGNWFIIQLKGKEKIDIAADNNKDISTLKQKVIERRAKKFGTQYLKQLLSDVKFRITESLFNKLSSEIFDRYSYRVSQDTTRLYKALLLDEKDVKIIKSKFSNDELNANIVAGNDFNLTTDDLLMFIMFEDFTLLHAAKPGVEQKLFDFIKYFVEQKLITKEGYRQNLDKDPKVIEDLKLWKENLLAQLIQNRQIDTIAVNDDEINTFFAKQYNDKNIFTQVNIKEILVEKLETVEKLMNLLQEGADFSDLANQYSIRELTKGKGGEFGFFPTNMYGEIGKVAATLKIDEVFGPIKTNDGYSIIKLIDKKEIKSNKTFTDVKDIIKDQVKSEKSYNYLNENTAKLAKKFGLTINEQNFKDTKVTNVNMFTHRFMGFGGKIAAMPFTNAIYKWYKIYQNLKKESL